MILNFWKNSVLYVCTAYIFLYICIYILLINVDVRRGTHQGERHLYCLTTQKYFPKSLEMAQNWPICFFWNVIFCTLCVQIIEKTISLLHVCLKSSKIIIFKVLSKIWELYLQMVEGGSAIRSYETKPGVGSDCRETNKRRF